MDRGAFTSQSLLSNTDFPLTESEPFFGHNKVKILKVGAKGLWETVLGISHIAPMLAPHSFAVTSDR